MLQGCGDQHHRGHSPAGAWPPGGSAYRAAQRARSRPPVVTPLPVKPNHNGVRRVKTAVAVPPQRFGRFSVSPATVADGDRLSTDASVHLMNETGIDYWSGSPVIGACDASPADAAVVASSKSPVSGGSVRTSRGRTPAPDPRSQAPSIPSPASRLARPLCAAHPSDSAYCSGPVRRGMGSSRFDSVSLAAHEQACRAIEKLAPSREPRPRSSVIRRASRRCG